MFVCHLKDLICNFLVTAVKTQSSAIHSVWGQSTNAKKQLEFDANRNYTRQPVPSAGKQAIGVRRRKTYARVKREKTCNP